MLLERRTLAPTIQPLQHCDTALAMALRVFAGLIDRMLCSLMLLGTPLAPFAAYGVSGQTRFLRQPWKTARQAWRHTWAMANAEVIGRAVVSRFEPPQEIVSGECIHCGRCCLNKQCVFLEMSPEGKSSCSVHGGWLWNRLRCSDYPVSGADIALYACPTFTAQPATNARVIKLHTAH
jgi:hypothetical protein